MDAHETASPRSTRPDAIHSDIARGFIRCEVIDWRDLVEPGSHAEVARRASSGSRARRTSCATATC